MIVDLPGTHGVDHVRAFRRTWLGGEYREIRAYADLNAYRESGLLDFSQGEPAGMSRMETWHHKEIKFDGRDIVDRDELGLGFPFICLFKWLDDYHGYQGQIAIPTMLPARSGGKLIATLPYLPIWPALIANTTFWGGAWWSVLFLPAVVRRRRRIKRGRCPTCGYDRAGLTPDNPCPECGVTSTAPTRVS